MSIRSRLSLEGDTSRRPSRAHTEQAARQQAPEVDTFLAYSAHEVLRARDFDQMSAAELERARALIRRLDLGV